MVEGKKKRDNMTDKNYSEWSNGELISASTKIKKQITQLQSSPNAESETMMNEVDRLSEKLSKIQAELDRRKTNNNKDKKKGVVGGRKVGSILTRLKQSIKDAGLGEDIE